MHGHFFWGSILGVLAVSVFAKSEHSTLAFMREDGKTRQIYISDEYGNNQKPLAASTEWQLYPDITSDGNEVAFVEGKDEKHLNIVIYFRNELRREYWTIKEDFYLHPDISGNKKWLAYVRPESMSRNMRVVYTHLEQQRKSARVADRVGMDGSTSRVYDAQFEEIPSSGDCFFPSFTSDGRYLVFQRNLSKTKKEIVLYDVEAKTEKVLAGPSDEVMSPSFSFDDTEIVFTAKVQNNWDIYVYNRIDLTTKRLVHDVSRDFAPSFFPDASVLFASDRSGNFQIYKFQRNATGFEANMELVVSDPNASLYAPSISGNEAIQFAEKPAIPNPARSSFGMVSVGEYIFMAGGHQGHEHTYPKESFLDELWVFNKNLETWTKLASRPNSAHGYSIFAKEFSNGGKKNIKLYAFGGFAFNENYYPKWHSLDAIDEYDMATNTWRQVGVLPRKRSSNTIAVYGDFVYFLGGWDATPRFKGDIDGTFHQEVDRFNMATYQVESSVAFVPMPLRRAFSVCQTKDKAYLVGGLGQGTSHLNLVNNVTEFDLATLQFKEMPSLPFATFAPAVGIVDESLYVFGGMYKTAIDDLYYVSHIFKWTTSEDRWKHTGRYLGMNRGFAMVGPYHSGKSNALAVMGGHSYFDGSDGPVNNFDVIEVY